jgi:L,D-peptidoglycan transpeptidase YkuD (ErfK/YbiS/YcfS/YnhG family)
MIIVKKSGYLNYKKLKFRCALGKGGIKKKIKEGDDITPEGLFKITKIYYRADRIKKIHSPIKKKKLKGIWDGVMILRVIYIINK